MKVREGQSQMVLTTKNGKIVDQSITQVHNSINLNLKVFVHPLENGNPFTFYGRHTSRQSEMQKGSSTLRISISLDLPIPGWMTRTRWLLISYQGRRNHETEQGS